MKRVSRLCLVLSAATLMGCEGQDWPLDEPIASSGELVSAPAPALYAMTELPPLPGGTVAIAHAIGADERIVGEAGACDPVAGCSRVAVYWDVGRGPVVIPALPGTVSNKATGITDAGVIVGTSRDARNRSHGWRWTALAGTTEVLGPGGVPLVVAAASPSGWTTGIHYPPGMVAPRAFRFHLGTGAFEALFPTCVRSLLHALGMAHLIPTGSAAGDCLGGRDLVATRGFSVDALGNVAGELEVGVGQAELGWLWRGGGSADGVNLRALNGTIEVREATAVAGSLLGPYVAWDGSTRIWSWSAVDGGLLGDLGLHVSAFPSGFSSQGRLVGYRTTGPQLPLTVRAGSIEYLELPGGVGAGDAVAVNRCGNVAGNALDGSSRSRAFRWAKTSCD